MARHPADNLDDDPEVRAILDEPDPFSLNPGAFNLDPGAAAARLSDWDVAHARRLREARNRAWARRTAAEKSRTYRRARQWRLGGWTVIAIIAVSCWLCGFACALLV